jgi:hypothetical protein
VEYHLEFDLGVERAVAPSRRGDKLLQEIAAIFASIFHVTQHLDIIFLSEGGESEIRDVCKPFFELGRDTNDRIN